MPLGMPMMGLPMMGMPMMGAQYLHETFAGTPIEKRNYIDPAQREGMPMMGMPMMNMQQMMQGWIQSNTMQQKTLSSPTFPFNSSEYVYVTKASRRPGLSIGIKRS